MTENRLENSVMVELQVEVGMLKKEVLFINKLFERMEVVINKIDSQHDILIDKTTKTELNYSLTKEELFNLYNSLEKTEREISERLSSIERLLFEKIDKVDSDLSTRLDKQEEVTGGLSNIKIIFFGIIAVITFLSTNLDFIKKIFN